MLRPLFRARMSAERKPDGSPVTAADCAAERAIRDALHAHHPDDPVFGEEGGGAETSAVTGRLWVVDPIDGTRAFLTGRPSFCTLIALLEDGIPVLGVIDQPVIGERWVGVRGEPTSFRGPIGGFVGTRADAVLAEAELSSTAPEALGPGKRRFARLARAAARTYWGGDAYAYGLLALGQIDLVAEWGLKLWDWAALVPVVEGAGGLMSDWEGAPLRPGAPVAALAGGNRHLHRDALALLRGDGGSGEAP